MPRLKVSVLLVELLNRVVIFDENGFFNTVISLTPEVKDDKSFTVTGLHVESL